MTCILFYHLIGIAAQGAVSVVPTAPTSAATPIVSAAAVASFPASDAESGKRWTKNKISFHFGLVHLNWSTR